MGREGTQFLTLTVQFCAVCHENLKQKVAKHLMKEKLRSC